MGGAGLILMEIGMVGFKLGWAVENCDGQAGIFTLSGQLLDRSFLIGRNGYAILITPFLFTI